MKKQKFSMIEILAVVAVTATLSTMLVSSIKTSKDIALQATCMSNISQIRAVTELHRKDFGKLPYSELWLTDFSYASNYIKGDDTLDIFTCPGSGDETLTSSDQLSTETSYYYLPSINALTSNLVDGNSLGINFLDIPQLNNLDQLVIYDKSPDHHNGKVNAAYLFSDDGNQADLEGRVVSLSDVSSLPTLDGSGNLIIDDPDTYGRLNINPANSDGNIFTLTDTDGNEIEIRDDSPGTGSAVSVSLKVKSQGRTLNVNGEEIELSTNTTYDITAIDSEGEENTEDPYFNYELSQEGNGNGQWWLELFAGSGSIQVTNASTGSSQTISGNGNGNGNGNGRNR